MAQPLAQRNVMLLASAGLPNDAANQQAIVRAVLESLPRFTAPSKIVDLPFAWPVAVWEQDVVRTSEAEAHVVLDQRTRGEFDVPAQHFTRQMGAEAATFCAYCAR